jgi:hypothetical protein
MSDIATKRNKQLSPANTKKLAGFKIREIKYMINPPDAKMLK